MSFEVVNGGIFTTMQDLGRYGYAHLGVTSSGAMDEYAYKWALKLLDDVDTNALEILMGGLQLKATADTYIAVTGADLDFKINGVSKPIWQSIKVKKGDTLSFGMQKSGMRAYLSVKGGFKTQKIKGSYSTTIREGIGDKLKKGDILKCESFQKQPLRRLKQEYIPTYQNELTLRLVLGYQDHYFTDEQKEKLFNSEYKLSQDISRMGYKLNGPALTPKSTSLISEGIAYGAVQIPKEGEPIILLKERQTIGGYPKIGSVIPEDCFKLSQMPIGSTIRFKRATKESF
ncbi:MAG: biotin-dependent carboxyltransferase family protein [Sulfurimonas sp.]